ncbi:MULTISPECIES: hypothetical protein [unclassified Pseudomonas]|uniref:hypothetical protein n=1 Tax=unclassified Pseudomonas TaxID=196821 RepID=UPI001FFF9737|nr:hypothetical protein [Pseudomonas sp. MWU12-2020]
MGVLQVVVETCGGLAGEAVDIGGAAGTATGTAEEVFAITGATTAGAAGAELVWCNWRCARLIADALCAICSSTQLSAGAWTVLGGDVQPEIAATRAVKRKGLRIIASQLSVGLYRLLIVCVLHFLDQARFGLIRDVESQMTRQLGRGDLLPYFRADRNRGSKKVGVPISSHIHNAR